MKGLLDDAMAIAGKEIQSYFDNQAMKEKTSRTVTFTRLVGEGEATVETAEDGEHYFVTITFNDDGFKVTAASAKGNSRGDALANAERAFTKNGYGYIRLTWPTEDDE